MPGQHVVRDADEVREAVRIQEPQGREEGGAAIAVTEALGGRDPVNQAGGDERRPLVSPVVRRQRVLERVADRRSVVKRKASRESVGLVDRSVELAELSEGRISRWPRSTRVS